MGKLKVGIVSGDDILDRLDEFLFRGIELRNMDTGESLQTVRDQIQSANAYNHFSLLKSLEAGFGLPCLNHACDTNVGVMSDLFSNNTTR